MLRIPGPSSPSPAWGGRCAWLREQPSPGKPGSGDSLRSRRSRWAAGPLILLLAFLLALATPTLAREEIRSYTSNITLSTNGSVDVVETIVVNAENVEINHGIYRDIPTVLINEDKSRLRSNLDVIEVKKDGVPEPYSVDNIGAGFKRIKIGSADVWLSPRTYTYTIHYTMSRMARMFADHDEIFWNVTGNYWVFPILEVTATLNLPPGAVAGAVVGFTGVPGSQEQAVDVFRNSDSQITFRTTRELRSMGDVSEGLTIAAKFAKGVLVEPQGLTAVGNWLSDHRDLVFPAIAVFIVLLYNFFAWSAVGRDPARGTIIPLFHPPQGLSPALTHYISAMGFKQSGWTAFTASIFDLGVKGLLQIDKVGKAMKLTSTGEATQKLPLGEQGIYDFVRARGVVTVDKTDGPKLNEKRGELVSALQRENREVYFKNNAGYSLIGVVLAAIMLGALVLLDVIEPVFLIVAVVIAIVVGVIIGAMMGIGRGGGGNIVGRLIGGVWIVIVAANLFGSGISALSGLRIDTGLIAATSIIVIEIVFAILMRAPTVQGRKLMDQIEGFKMYLNTAEKNRLNYVDKGEPQMTVKRFEAILPFAIALGVEKPWSQRFEADLARNAVADATTGVYSPIWYTGTDWSSSSSSGFSNTVSSLSAGMSAAMIAAQPSSSSGSGFSGGGGGGSGGGGGGGGGGGW